MSRPLPRNELLASHVAICGDHPPKELALNGPQDFSNAIAQLPGAPELTEEQKAALNEPWNVAASTKEAEAKSESDRRIEDRLKDIAARTMNDIFANGTCKSVPPEIVRALAREVMQHIQQFRTNANFKAASPVAQETTLGDLQNRMRNLALKRRNQLRNYHDADQEKESKTGFAGLTSVLGYQNTSLMREDKSWLAELHHDAPQHGVDHAM